MIIITRDAMQELVDNSKLVNECIMPYSDGKYIIDDDLVDLFKQIDDLTKQIDYNETIKFLVRDTNQPFDQKNLDTLKQDRSDLLKQAIDIANDKRYIVCIILDYFVIVIFFNDDRTEVITKFNKFDIKLYFPFCLDLSNKVIEIRTLDAPEIDIIESSK